MSEKPENLYTSTREALLALIEAYLKKHPDVTPESFGWKTIKDVSLVKRLREGKDITTAKLDDILSFLKGNPAST